ncbi:MAG TPA: carboxypeptidase-like regulatory domain-containing protein [Candidatus Cybelea sp.]|nr:carboxypeptidase-like regulatory domain-containing protein [Candidatus Cybelea sp.]
MNRSSLQRTLCAMGLLLAFGGQAGVALAGTSGGIGGIVTDAKTGAPISGVRLQITSPSQSVTTTTDAHGRYIVFTLQPDDYTVSAQKNGYDGSSISGEAVFADQTQQYDLKLTPASEASSSGGATP